MDLFTFESLAKLAAFLALYILWETISPRLPGSHGKVVDGSVEIVPTVELWLKATVLTVFSLILVLLFIVLVIRIPDARSPIILVAGLLWACGLALGASSIAKVTAVKRYRLRYDSFGFSYFSPKLGCRVEVAFDQVERILERWIGPDFIEVRGDAIPFAEDAGGSRQFATFIDQNLLNRETGLS